MSLTHKFKQVVDSRVDRYNSPTRDTIAGVDILYVPTGYQDSVSWNTWKGTLEEMLPRFERVGWLDGFSNIKIEQGSVTGDGVGQYFLDDTSINLENDTDLGWGKELVVGHTRRHILTHEIIHHAHMYIHGFGHTDVPFDSDFIEENVSFYGRNNILEAIAEVGCGIALGHKFPDEVHEFYEEHDGPPEAYDL